MIQESNMFNRQSPSMLRNQRGFTLSEILVTTAIFAIIMIAALAVYDQSNKVFKGSTEAADMQQSTRIGFDKLVSDVRMAGFDYNRGGIPTNSWEAMQPDEQIEYAGTSVIAFRSNFNYNTQLTAGNGLENSITPKNTDAKNIFPYVTTNNNEIVIYALRSTDASKNTEKISFYVDDYTPRSVFPSTISPGPAAGVTSKKEHLLVLGPATCGTCGIDTTNANPPYTLYRVTVADVKAGLMGTPVAENIRSLNFTYYSDATGKTLLTNPDGTAIDTVRNADGTTFTTANTGAIGGDGQYDPDSVGTTTNFDDRNMRGFIGAIKIDLVGMNATPDIQGYSNPTETISAIKQYRQYSLSSLIVPRNLGKTGFPEPVYSPPGPPTITGMCTGFCGAPVIYWTPPVGGGPVEKYEISWDTNSLGAFAAPHVLQVIDPTATSAILPDFGTEDLSVNWYYRIVAINSNGSSPYSPLYAASPKNDTTPKGVAVMAATDSGGAPAPAAQANQITLTWTSPTQHQSPKNVLACSGTGGSTDGTTIPSEVVMKYRIFRGTLPNFTSAQGATVLDYTSGKQPPSGVPGSTYTWVDDAENDAISAPANCVQYYYRIVAVNRCVMNGAYNVGGTLGTAYSAVFPAFGTPAIKGSANGTGTPNAPIALAVDGTSACPGPGPIGPTYCQIKISWPRVTTDTSANTIGVDTYRIYRKSKHQSNLPNPLYTTDTTFGGGTGYVDVPAYSQLAGGTLSYTDNTAVVTDSIPPIPAGAGLMSYEYTVAAKGCSTFSAESSPVQFPTSCTGVPTISVSGGTGGGNGNSPATPYVLNTGDAIRTQQPGGVTYTSVIYKIFTYPAGVQVGAAYSATGAAGLFPMPWNDLTSDAMYTVTIETTDSAGCTATYIKYVTQQSIAPCAFSNVTTGSALLLATSGSGSTGKNNEFVNIPVTVSGTDTLSFTGKDVIVTWNDPRTPPSGKTFTASYDKFEIFSGISTGSANIPGSATMSTSCCPVTVNPNQAITTAIPGVSGAVPGAPSDLPTSHGFSLRLTFSHPNSGGEKDFSDTTVNPVPQLSPVKKICIAYTIPSEPGVTKKCNLVGQAASTLNPVNCD